MKGLLLITDNSCNKFRFGVEDNLFRHKILNGNTVFLKKELLLKTIMAVHRIGIYSSLWCRAEIFDLGQAAFSANGSGCPHCLFMYESFPIETTFEIA